MILASITKYKTLFSTLIVALILILGAYLRLYKISEYMTFLGDEGRDVLVVKRILVDHKFTLLGPTASVGGFFLGPIYYYFMLPFLWAWKLDPTGPAVMVALFGIATIYLVFRVGRDVFNFWVGLFASSLYAVSPVVIAYSRSSWNPNLVPFFSTLLIYLLWRVIAKQKYRDLFWVGITMGIGLQLHYLFTFLFGVVLVWFLIFGRNKEFIKYYLLGIFGFIVGFSPFLAFEVRKGFPNSQSITRFLFAGKETGFDLNIFLKNLDDITFRIFGRLLLRLPPKEAWNNFPKWQITAWMLATKILIYSSLGVIFYKFLEIYIKNTNRLKQTSRIHIGVILLLVWFSVCLFLFGFYKKSIYDYYFGIFFTVPFILFGFTLWRLSLFKYSWIFSGVIWFSLLYFNWQGRPFIYPPNNQLKQAKTIAGVAFEKTGGKPFNFALITDGNSDHVYRYFFEIWGNPPVVIENEINDTERRTVTGQLIVICENPSCQPLGHPLWEIAGFGPAEIVGSWDVPFVRIFKLTPVVEKK